MLNVAGTTHKLHTKMFEIVQLEQQVKVEETRILDKENEIMSHTENVMQKLDLFISRQGGNKVVHAGAK